MLLLIAGLISGYVYMRPTDPYAPVNVRYVSSPEGDAAHQTSETPRGPLTLSQAIETALANNPEIAAQDWDVSAAQARQDQAFGARLPRVGILGGYTHTWTSRGSFPPAGTENPGFSAGIPFQEIWLCPCRCSLTYNISKTT